MGFIVTEFIQNLDLFAAGGDDIFEVETGGMPNGDDCLIVRGDVSQDGRAFDNVSGVTTPDIASPTFVPGGGTIVLWLKLGTLGGTDLGTASTANSILTVQSATAPLQNAVVATSSTSGSSWKICAGGVNGLTIQFGTSWKSSGGTKQWRGASATLTLDTWHMLAFTKHPTLGNQIVVSLDGGAYGGSNGSSTSTASAASSANQLGVGSTSTEAGVGVRPGLWRIGKVSFHSVDLTVDQLTMLYQSMTT